MPEITFTHPDIPVALHIDTGVNEIGWTYSLNTQSYPTYGGEVVQILSVFIDNLTIQGEVRTYEKMEEIYGWFLQYFFIATQGKIDGGTYGEDEYNEKSVKMHYPHRGWELLIQPISLPGLKYSTDTVVPQWQLEAVVTRAGFGTDGHVSESYGKLVELSVSKAEVNNFSKLQGQIGFVDNNPFSDPTANPSLKKTKDKATVSLSGIVDWYTKLVNTYASGDVSALAGVSKPANQSVAPSDQQKKATHKKKKTPEQQQKAAKDHSKAN